MWYKNSFPYACLYRHALVAEGLDGVATDAGRDDEGLGIVNLEGRELSFGAFDEGSLTVNKVEDIDAAFCVVLYGTRERVPARLDELVGM